VGMGLRSQRGASGLAYQSLLPTNPLPLPLPLFLPLQLPVLCLSSRRDLRLQLSLQLLFLFVIPEGDLLLSLLVLRRHSDLSGAEREEPLYLSFQGERSDPSAFPLTCTQTIKSSSASYGPDRNKK
jgi:hypothetical protein